MVKPDTLSNIIKKYNLTEPTSKSFLKILNCNFSEINRSITYEEYKELFFVETDNVKSTIKKVVDDINANKQFIFIHGYAKNGKTCFYYFMRNELANYLKPYNTHVIIKRLNFDTKFPNLGMQPSFLEAVIEWVKIFLDVPKSDNENHTEIFKTKMKTIINIYDFLKNNKITDNEDDDEDEIHRVNSLFINFRTKLKLLASETLNEMTYSLEWSEKYENKRDIILSGLTDKDAADLLTYYVFLYIIVNKNKFNETGKYSEKKIVFVFDNIDDILSDSAIAITGNYIFDLCNTIELFQIYFGNEFKTQVFNYDFKDCLAFIYILRSANFVNANNRFRSLNASRSDRGRFAISSSPSYTISTIHSSVEIIEKRFQTYELLMGSINKPIPAYLKEFKKYIISSLKNQLNGKDGNENHKEIFRIWNGNREIAIDNFCFDRLECDLKNIPSKKKYPYLYKGFFLKLFLASFKSRESWENIYDIFMDLHHAPNCNLSRLILTYVFNKTKERKIGEPRDILKKGVSLYDLLLELSRFRTLGKHTYPLNIVQKTFNRLFHYEIDDWNQLLTCTKSTEKPYFRKTIKQGKRINLDEEILLFFDSLSNPQDSNILAVKAYLDGIRLYYNDSAKYLISYIITHFEFVSLYEANQENPLVSDLWKNIRDYNSQLYFKKILDDVFKAVWVICFNSINHYFSSVYPIYKPHDYCEVSGFAISNKFFFDLIISRHMTYLEEFRNYTLESKVFKNLNSLSRKRQINYIIISKMKDYILLFDKLYIKFDKRELPESLIKTKFSFKLLRSEIDMIADSNYEDFTRRVELPKDFNKLAKAYIQSNKK